MCAGAVLVLAGASRRQQGAGNSTRAAFRRASVRQRITDAPRNAAALPQIGTQQRATTTGGLRLSHMPHIMAGPRCACFYTVRTL